ncbi:MAG TPA: hypothetical protein VM432_07315 [Bdellovibrionales bacterium]|jgi:hypothetical protein|nr:hypothetical protein [Bdellovibrionales bacterium]
MRAFAFVSVMILASISFASGLAINDGTYSGQGFFTNSETGADENYSSTLTIENGAVSMSYVYASGFSYTLNYTIVDGVNGLFTVMYAGAPAGTGYCAERSCHMDMNYVDSEFGAVQISRTMSWNEENDISVIGHNMTMKKFFVEELERQD